MSEPTVWIYFISRDSHAGVLSDKCRLWYLKPYRRRAQDAVYWWPLDKKNHGHIGEYPLKSIEGWFGIERIPETDIQLFKVEMGVTPKMLAESK